VDIVEPSPPALEHALITGASSGLGALFARELAADGWPLVLVARRGERLETLAAELRAAHGGYVLTIATDLTEPGAVRRLVADLGRRGLPIGRLINNAGDGERGAFAELSLPRELEIMRLNMEVVVELTHRLLPGMRARKKGDVLNVASLAAFQPGPLMAVYYATKAFVLAFSEALHEELKPDGIVVTALCPGPLDTALVDRSGLRDRPVYRLLGRRPLPVVQAGLRALDRGQAVVLPGALVRLTAASMRFMPPGLPRKIAHALQR